MMLSQLLNLGELTNECTLVPLSEELRTRYSSLLQLEEATTVLEQTLHVSTQG